MLANLRYTNFASAIIYAYRAFVVDSMFVMITPYNPINYAWRVIKTPYTQGTST